MEHVYAALLLNEANEELSEPNLTAVLEAAGCDVVESRTKALVAALEGVDVDRIGGGDAADAAAGTDGPDGLEAPHEESDTAGPTATAAPPAGDATRGPDAAEPVGETPFPGDDGDLPGDGDGDRSDDEPATVE